jgi:hypothetical protein
MAVLGGAIVAGCGESEQPSLTGAQAAESAVRATIKSPESDVGGCDLEPSEQPNKPTLVCSVVKGDRCAVWLVQPTQGGGLKARRWVPGPSGDRPYQCIVMSAESSD